MEAKNKSRETSGSVEEFPDRLPAEGQVAAADDMPAATIFERQTTLKDAFSMLLASDVQAGIVVDGDGAVLGLVTADMIGERMRQAS